MHERFKPRGVGSSNYAQVKASLTIETNGTAYYRIHVKHPTEGWNEQALHLAGRLDSIPMPTSKDEAVSALWDALGFLVWEGKPGEAPF